MMNFRADRARQILIVSIGQKRHLVRPSQLPSASFWYDELFCHLDEFVTPLPPPVELADTLGEVVAAAGRRQLRLAETEKYPHVTFFFNGGDETMRDGEDRVWCHRQMCQPTTNFHK